MFLPGLSCFEWLHVDEVSFYEISVHANYLCLQPCQKCNRGQVNLYRAKVLLGDTSTKVEVTRLVDFSHFEGTGNRVERKLLQTHRRRQIRCMPVMLSHVQV